MRTCRRDETAPSLQGRSTSNSETSEKYFTAEFWFICLFDKTTYRIRIFCSPFLVRFSVIHLFLHLFWWLFQWWILQFTTFITVFGDFLVTFFVTLIFPFLFTFSGHFFGDLFGNPTNSSLFLVLLLSPFSSSYFFSLFILHFLVIFLVIDHFIQHIFRCHCCFVRLLLSSSTFGTSSSLLQWMMTPNMPSRRSESWNTASSQIFHCWEKVQITPKIVFIKIQEQRKTRAKRTFQPTDNSHLDCSSWHVLVS